MILKEQGFRAHIDRLGNTASYVINHLMQRCNKALQSVCGFHKGNNLECCAGRCATLWILVMARVLPLNMRTYFVGRPREMLHHIRKTLSFLISKREELRQMRRYMKDVPRVTVTCRKKIKGLKLPSASPGDAAQCHM